MLVPKMLLAGTQISVFRLWLSLAGGQGQNQRKGVNAQFPAHMHAHTQLPCRVCPYKLLSNNPVNPPSTVLLRFMGLSQGPGVCWICLPRDRLSFLGGTGNYTGGENKQSTEQNGTQPNGHIGAIFSLLVQWESSFSFALGCLDEEVQTKQEIMDQ